MKRIFVIGSLNIDLSVEVDHFPQKGETILGSNTSMVPGGKGGNQAIAASFYGGDVRMLGAVGKDIFGETIISNLKKYGVNTDSIKVIDDESTGMAFISLTKSDNQIVVAPGANYRVSIEDVDSFIYDAKEGDLLVIQLELPLEVVRYAIDHAFEKHMLIILNPAPATEAVVSLLPKCDYVIPNESELTILTGIMEIEKASKSLKSLNTIVTLGSKGVYYPDEDVRFEAIEPEKAIDTVGAGDCFIGAFAAEIALGRKPIEAIDFARGASSLSCQKKGTSGALHDRDAVNKAIERDE